MVTVKNYKDYVGKIDPAKLTPGQKGTYELIEDGGMDHYGNDDDITDAIDLYLKSLNKSGMFDEKPAAKKQSSAKAAVKEQKETKAKPTKEVKPKAVKKGNVNMISPDVKVIKRFASLHNKDTKTAALQALLRSLQKQIVEKVISSKNKFADDVTDIQDKLVKLCKQAKGEQTVKVEINDQDLARYVAIAGGESVFASIPVMKAYIGMQGRTVTVEQVEKLVKRMESKAILQDDPFYETIQSLRKALNKELRKADESISFRNYELGGFSGLGALLSSIDALCNELGCGCKSGLAVSSKKKELSGFSPSSSNLSVQVNTPVQMHNKREAGPMTAQQMASINYKVYSLGSIYDELLGKVEKGFSVMIYGTPGSGKSTFAIAFGRHLAQNFGPTLYVSSEEFKAEKGSFTLTDKLVRAGGAVPLLYFDNKLVEKEIPKYKYVILDSTRMLHLKYDEFARIKDKYPEVSFIIIMQSTKAGSFKGEQEWLHIVDAEIHLDSGVATTRKNRFGHIGRVQVYEPLKNESQETEDIDYQEVR
jgi:energy-coupling factor transporter ATP-binding protein EcfA2